MFVGGGIVCLIIIVGRVLFNWFDNSGGPVPKIKRPYKDYR